MFSRQQQLRVLTLITVFCALAHANWLNSNPSRREIVEKDLLGGVDSALGGLAGGVLGTAAASSTTASTAGDKTTTPSSASSTPTPTTSTTPSSTPSASSTPTPTDSTSTSDTPTPTPTPTPTTSKSQSDTTTTQIVQGSQTSSTISSTSSSASATNSGAIGQNDSSPTTMSAKTKSTVIGVVVGVGGAIVLAGLFVVAWRIWGRKKNEDESDGLMGFRSGSAGHEKPNSGTGNGPANPFQSTLENYHNPARNVNASSNF